MEIENFRRANNAFVSANLSNYKQYRQKSETSFNNIDCIFYKKNSLQGFNVFQKLSISIRSLNALYKFKGDLNKFVNIFYLLEDAFLFS